MNKFSFTGISIDNLSFSEALHSIAKLMRDGNCSYVVTPNAAHIYSLYNDLEFKKAYDNASLVLADGLPLVWASRLLGNPLKERVAGSDLFGKVCQIAADNNKNIFLLGGIEGSEKAAENKLKRLYSNINISSFSPRFGFENDEKETDAIINTINNSNIDLLFMCVGAPKSEKWLFINRDKLKIKLACCVGTAMDLFVGREKRAPSFMQKTGLEWLWRLMQNPGRLWKRYLIGNTFFIWMFIKELTRKFRIANRKSIL